MNKNLLNDLMSMYDYCYELFNIAWKLNKDEDSRTAFSQKTTDYMPFELQMLSYLIDTDSVYVTKEDYGKLLEYKQMYEDLCK